MSRATSSGGGAWGSTTRTLEPQSSAIAYAARGGAVGYAVEGSLALLDHAFGTVGLDRVWAETMAVNTASRRVMEKLGLVFERRYVGDWEHPVDGWEQGEVVHAIDRAAYLNDG